jgi:predicted RND superfamily exporter protein
MLKKLGEFIEKRPLLVITVVLLITIGFATLIPSIEFRTDFADFMPDEEVVESFIRIGDYFGQNNQIMFLYLEKDETDNILTPEALREQYFIQNELLGVSEVNSVFGFPYILDQVCFLEFGKTFENCTDKQIQNVLEDILKGETTEILQVFKENDQNEKVDYKRYEKIGRGISVDEIDIKNCFIELENDNFIFNIEVFDLSSLESKIRSPVPGTNVVEWYLDFQNVIFPDERLNISYRLAAHLEPKHSLWIVGNGLINNIRTIFENLRNKELFNAYNKEAYLWVKPFEESMYFPLPLESALVDFNTMQNYVRITVSREEMGRYGVAPRFGAFELPAKITDFSAGTRYYKPAFTNLPWLRVSANTSYLIEKLDKVRTRPIIGNIATRVLKQFANLTWEDFDMLFEMIEEQGMFPEYIALKDLATRWVTLDNLPNEGNSNNIFFIRPVLFDDLELMTRGFLSKDYEETGSPEACLMIIYMNASNDYDENLELNKLLIEKLEKLDYEYDYVTVEATGDGVVSTQINEVTEEANLIIMPMIFIVIIGILFVSFRKISYVILPMLALVVSTIWLFGTMVLLDKPFTTMAVALVPLIMGLGVDYSVHLSHSYRLELASGRKPGEAIKKAVSEIGAAMFLAMLTTIIAFLSFLSASLPPIRDFGLLLALGITYTFITAITLQAAVRYFIDRHKKKFHKRKKKEFKLNIFMGSMAQTILGHQKKIIVTLLLITLIAGYGASQIKTGFDFNSFLPEETPSMQLYEKIEENFPFASQQQESILLEGDLSSRKALIGIMKTHENFEDDTLTARNADGSVKSTSIYTIILQAVNNNISLIEEFNLDEETKIPKTDTDVKLFFDYLYENVEYGIQTQNNLNKNEKGSYDAAVIKVFIDLYTEEDDVNLQRDLEVLYKELNADLEEYGDVEAIVTGMLTITHIMTGSLTESQLLSTGISLILAAIVLIVAYRKPTLGLITVIPVGISMIWILGTMFFIGYDLNILTVTVTSLTIGIGIDYAIHATERFKLVADKTGDITVAVCETISKTGGALLIAALTTSLGFAILVFAPIPPEQQFGVITAITIAYSFITSVLLLPLILAHWAKWRKKKKGYIISSAPVDENYLNDVEACDQDE